MPLYINKANLLVRLPVDISILVSLSLAGTVEVMTASGMFEIDATATAPATLGVAAAAEAAAAAAEPARTRHIAAAKACSARHSQYRSRLRCHQPAASARDRTHHIPVPVSHEWEDGVKPVLRLITQPVVWEAHFHAQSVEVFGSGPKWAALLFTKKKRLQLKERIESVLEHAGFRIGSPAVS